MGKEPHEMTLEDYLKQQDTLPLGEGLPFYEYRKAIASALHTIGAKSVTDPRFDAAYESAIRKLREKHARWQHESLCELAKLSKGRASDVATYWI